MLKEVIFFLEFVLSFWEILVCQTWKVFNTKFGPQSKDWKSSYQVRKVLALFCILVTLIVGWNLVKGLRVTKNVKQIKLEGVCGRLEAKNCFQRQPFTKYLRETLFFVRNSALQEKFIFFFFSADFLLILTIKLILGERLATRLKFHEIFEFPWYFLFS